MLREKNAKNKKSNYEEKQTLKREAERERQKAREQKGIEFGVQREYLKKEHV